MLSSGGRSNLLARKSLIYRIGESEPHKIGWAHLTLGKNNGCQIYLEDGTEETLHANGEDSKALLELVRNHAPQAILGYGPEQKAKFIERVKAARLA